MCVPDAQPVWQWPRSVQNGMRRKGQVEETTEKWKKLQRAACRKTMCRCKLALRKKMPKHRFGQVPPACAGKHP
jgi:hypothetical protein